jgi:hypothetical protein
MEIFTSLDLGRETVLHHNRCRVSLESIFLSDITTADGRYLEDFVFNPGEVGGGHLLSSSLAKSLQETTGTIGSISGIRIQP